VTSGRLILALAGALIAVALNACGNGDASGAERVIRIQANDSLAFEPDTVSVQTGETVRFVVTNSGEEDHEFVLGPESVQMAHEEASEAGEEHGGMHVEGQLAALELSAGATEEAVVTFDQSGEVLFGCHEPGHYDGGMVGTVTVS
jgi:uncharacterized cupredoxin-like copper-binding protein